ncbi:hypothetical protein BGY98DRAFT_119311 [Russula aff. rugulosa BPL654]|nr:hypothetical protein BGY98DRAFT_119311 [Russula aff. rugulosa BPL654]
MKTPQTFLRPEDDSEKALLSHFTNFLHKWSSAWTSLELPCVRRQSVIRKVDSMSKTNRTEYWCREGSKGSILAPIVINQHVSLSRKNARSYVHGPVGSIRTPGPGLEPAFFQVIGSVQIWIITTR